MSKKKCAVYKDCFSLHTSGACVVLLLLSAFLPCLPLTAQSNKNTSPVIATKEGLQSSMDALGNSVPDFSYAGYASGGEPIPDVPVRVVVPLSKGDATSRIQFALDYVASLPVNAAGWRGAVLLEKGRYEITGGLRMNASGVILRGSGAGVNGTVLFAKGNGRETLIRIAGK